MKKITLFLLSFIMIFTLSACTQKTKEVPSVRYENNEISVNGKFIASSEGLYVNRMDAQVVSLDSDSGYINVDADGKEIKLKNVITDRKYYESTIGEKIDSHRMMPITSGVVPERRVDLDVMLEDMSSYDYAMKLPFYFAGDAVCIVYKDEYGSIAVVAFTFTDDKLNPAYAPDGGITCHWWMIGRLGYGTPGLWLDEYADHWVESSLEIMNYEGGTYYWFCVAYEDEEENKTYYSAIARKDEDGRNVIYLQQVDGPFFCCDIKEFTEIMESL